MKDIELEIVKDELGLGVLIHTEQELMEYRKGMGTKYKDIENVWFTEELLVKHGMKVNNESKPTT